MKYITRNIWLISIVSLLNDISSEMLIPVMPLFLSSIGFSSVLIGLLEGAAEAMAGFTKGYFGRWSDAHAVRMPFVRLGYGMSAVAKPMMGVLALPLWIFSARMLDRLGKGVRTAARDALLSDECTAENKGKVFGFHRAMDTTGAAIGPVIALLLLSWFGTMAGSDTDHYQWLFLLAFFPAVVAVLFTFLIKERKHEAKGTVPSLSHIFRFAYWKESSAKYRKTVALLLLFAVFNSSDAFLLLRIGSAGFSAQQVIGCYIFYNIVYAIAAFPLGHMGDAIGLKRTFIIGLLLFAMVYTGFAFNTSLAGFVLLYAVYGLFAAATDGISKALVSNLVPKSESASALGTFSGLSSIAALLASVTAGLLWKYVSPSATFIASSAAALLVAVLMVMQRREIEQTEG